MKAQHVRLLLVVSLMISILATGCYRKKIQINETSAQNEVISIDQAVAYQKSFISGRAELHRLVSDSSFLPTHFDMGNAETFSKDAIALLLNVDGADSVRIYRGVNEKGQVNFILLPVDKNGKDIITTLIGNKLVLIPGIPKVQAQSGGGQAVEQGQNCPPCQIMK
ncbi:MAG: hypothetical protein JST87_15180 [Bacteroidetes bacterium]|nr:hypothetical protein [Bacteroidota bacterium]MBS1932760.1 hypothetical protein [Bacteroidota bacterium]